jgi:hypothetical protein
MLHDKTSPVALTAEGLPPIYSPPPHLLPRPCAIRSEEFSFHESPRSAERHWTAAPVDPADLPETDGVPHNWLPIGIEPFGAVEAPDDLRRTAYDVVHFLTSVLDVPAPRCFAIGDSYLLLVPTSRAFWIWLTDEGVPLDRLVAYLTWKALPAFQSGPSQQFRLTSFKWNSIGAYAPLAFQPQGPAITLRRLEAGVADRGPWTWERLERLVERGREEAPELITDEVWEKFEKVKSLLYEPQDEAIQDDEPCPDAETVDDVPPPSEPQGTTPPQGRAEASQDEASQDDEPYAGEDPGPDPDASQDEASQWYKKLRDSLKAAQQQAKGKAPPKPEQPRAVGHVLKVRRLADVESKPVFWLWRHRVPLGMLTILDGDPGEGKSTMVYDWAARVSRGRAMPLEAAPALAPADVVILAAEDDPSYTIRPRLDAAGADVTRIHLIEATKCVVDGSERSVVLPEDVDRVARLVKSLGAALVIIDPLFAYMDGKVDTHKDASSRLVLGRLKALAETTNAAIVALRHLNKDNEKSAMYRGGASIAFTASARSALIVAPHPQDPNCKVLATVKCNVGPKPRAITYSLAEAGDVPRLEWGQEIDLTADDLMSKKRSSNGGGRKGEETEAAADFLLEQLVDGPKEASYIEEAAKVHNVSVKSLRRAKERLGVRSYQQWDPAAARTKWYCALPQDEAA